MARAIEDTTNIYRFKTTHKGVYIGREEYRKGVSGALNERLAGQPYKDVKLVGPYGIRIGWNGWVPGYGTFKVERQQLIAQFDEVDQEPFLMWYTIETKHYEGGEPRDA